MNKLKQLNYEREKKANNIQFAKMKKTTTKATAVCVYNVREYERGWKKVKRSDLYKWQAYTCAVHVFVCDYLFE